MTTQNSKDEFVDDILCEYGKLVIDWSGGLGDRIYKTSRQKIIRAIESHIAQEVLKAQQEGHFFVEKMMRGGAIDFGFFYLCKCGYKANGKEELDGHIEWQLAQLRQSMKESTRCMLQVIDSVKSYIN